MKELIKITDINGRKVVSASAFKQHKRKGVSTDSEPAGVT